jgi:hypothetical protein
MVVGEGFEPSKAEPADLQSAPFDHSGIQPHNVCINYCKWCLGRDLNPHVHRGHGILSPVRLPIPPPRHNHLE